ncbi:MAG: DUF58 domain-containing protein [Myxococcota bacterium]|nr:DUF58 domain-containing protein [Myxococcota bacterium]
MHDATAKNLDPELFAQIRQIQIKTQHLVTDSLAGQYESAFKGRGMEFEEVRAYQPGDDIRHIDWKVTARSGAPHIKVHREERELTVMLLVDVSSSGEFGTARKFKNEIAAEVAAVLAYAAIKNNDRVGLIIFSDRIEHFVPPKKGRAHVWMVIRDILNFRPERRVTDLDKALEYLGTVIKRRCVAFLLSDFLDQSITERLRTTAKRHDITAISIADPREITLPPIGIVELEDAETGETILVDTHDAGVRESFRILGHGSRAERSDAFRAGGIGEISLRTDEPYIDSIVRFFRSRENRN